MNPHACLLALLIGPAAATAFAVQPPSQSPSERCQGVSRCCGHHRAAPRTRIRMHARRGGKGRRRGKTGGGVGPATAANGAAAVPVRETPSTSAAISTLAIQHAAHEELLEVAYTNRSILSPAVLSQALLRIAKVCQLPSEHLLVMPMPSAASTRSLGLSCKLRHRLPRTTALPTITAVTITAVSLGVKSDRRQHEHERTCAGSIAPRYLTHAFL